MYGWFEITIYESDSKKTREEVGSRTEQFKNDVQSIINQTGNGKALVSKSESGMRLKIEYTLN